MVARRSLRNVGNWPKQVTSTVLIDDVASGLVAAIDTPGIEGRSFNLVGDPCLSAQEYLDELDRCGGSVFNVMLRRFSSSISWIW